MDNQVSEVFDPPPTIPTNEDTMFISARFRGRDGYFYGVWIKMSKILSEEPESLRLATQVVTEALKDMAATSGINMGDAPVTITVGDVHPGLQNAELFGFTEEEQEIIREYESKLPEKTVSKY